MFEALVIVLVGGINLITYSLGVDSIVYRCTTVFSMVS